MTRYGVMVGYVHVFRDRAVIYMPAPRCSPSTTETVIDCDTNPITMVHDLAWVAKEILARGWHLGVEGWRAPLDGHVGIIATAHLVPRKEAKW